MPQAPIYEKKNNLLARLAPKVLLWLWFIMFQLNEKARQLKKQIIKSKTRQEQKQK